MRLSRVAVFAASVGASAFLYGFLRVGAETFGFTWACTLRTLGATAFVTSWIVLPALLLTRIASSPRLRPAAELLITWLITVILGAGVGELCVLADEASFIDQVARHPSHAFDRGRRWPYGNAGLVYVPGEGIHATD